MKKILSFFILVIACFLCGCNYSGLATLPEQIAIYQNIGFSRQDLSGDIIIGEASAHINTTQAINGYLTSHNVKSQVVSGLALYLPNEEPQTLDGLIYIYYFENANSAKTFYNFFKTTLSTNIYLYNQAVIQKGVSPLVISSARNTYYYNKFIQSLKK